MKQTTIADAYGGLETSSQDPQPPETRPPAPPPPEPLPRPVEAQLDQLRRELKRELASAIQGLPEIRQELRRTGQATLELASPLRTLLSDLEQLLPSLRVARPRAPRWLWIAAAIVAVMVVMIATQPALRSRVARQLLLPSERSALEMGEGLLMVYPRLSETQRKTLEQLLSPACASCSPSTTRPAAPHRP